VKRSPVGNALTDARILGESRTSLWNADGSEHSLVTGKIHNLRLALRKLNGVEIPAGQLFSFWKQVGRTSRSKGYVAGRELREGCLIPSIGGGLCQLSNALYDAALNSGFEIVERHAHTKVIPGSLAEKGRDATVFWNYVDLRFRSTVSFRIEAFLTNDSLVVRFRGNLRPHNSITVASRSPVSTVEDCVSCTNYQCFRHVHAHSETTGRTAYLLDEYWPEFDRYIVNTRRSHDVLRLPLIGERFGKDNYSWTTDGFDNVRQFPWFTLRRSLELRNISPHGGTRQRALLASSERLADLFGRSLTHEVTHLIVMQSLLPFLWRDGHLGGRTFDVLMNRLPLDVLQQRLDEASALHPESKTLTDFRADNSIVKAEREALTNARRIITPHSAVAKLFPRQAIKLDWELPAMLPSSVRASAEVKVVYPAATLARKGAYELRDALRGLNVRLVKRGADLEGADFWRGISVEPAGPDWLANARAVVLPSFVEHRPRTLMRAVAQRVPVIASTACGLENVAGVTSIEAGNVEALRDAISRLLNHAHN